MSWTPEGNLLALYAERPDTARDLFVLALDGDLTPELFLGTSFQERGLSFSPDGRWIAYVSDESGRDEVYVRPYPGPGGETIVSTGGGDEVVWSPDGGQLNYRNGEQLMAVDVSAAQSFSAAAPTPILEAPYAADIAAGGAGNPNYDVNPDGTSFVFVEHDAPSDSEDQQIRVILNWTSELERLVPPP